MGSEDGVLTWAARVRHQLRDDLIATKHNRQHYTKLAGLRHSYTSISSPKGSCYCSESSCFSHRISSSCENKTTKPLAVLQQELMEDLRLPFG